MAVRDMALALLLLIPGACQAQATPDSVPLQPLGAGHPNEWTERARIINGTTAAVLARQFDALAATADDYRDHRLRLETGAWKLAEFYGGTTNAFLSEPSPDGCRIANLPLLEEWESKAPARPEPWIAHAEALERLAWCHRGDGYAGQIDPDAMRRFEETAQQGYDLLIAHEGVAARDPQFYVEMMQYYKDLGFEPARFRALLDRAVSREPGYSGVYFAAFEYFKPQWFGSAGDQAWLADYAVAHTRNIEGTGFYARLQWYAFSCNCLKKSDVDWATMKKAMDDLDKAWPSDWNRTFFATFSCWEEDIDSTRRYVRSLTVDYVALWHAFPPREICYQVTDTPLRAGFVAN